ncbi:RteC domain-containing protein [Pedobacter gandavensis]|uniref:RteC domain-containing protein n=1 Tax=Pedobacter gandavensis TaxID=2679963 RepID=UPI00247A907E|nr:RteC domain-containing protein [Pedobacter gandavensis]WGQ08967.1 RteC domain-containing protein [Pedobacter gandavensis]
MSAEFIEKLYAGMQVQLENINGTLKEPVHNLTSSLDCITSTLERIKVFIRENPFETTEAEIYFFKYTKPRFYCWYIYVIELNNIIATVPIGTDQMIRDYYMEELSIVNRCFKIYSFSYQYYQLQETVKDEEFFLRSNRISFPIGQEHQVPDPEFSTNQDYVFSKFRAYEMLRDFIIRRLRLLYQNPDNVFITELLASKKRWWSGDKVELIEIAYGIYYTQRINGGKAEISHVIEWLEDSLNIDLSQAYRMFLDIRRRKTISYTKYLDEMREAIHQHIDESNSYKPKKKQQING